MALSQKGKLHLLYLVIISKSNILYILGNLFTWGHNGLGNIFILIVYFNSSKSMFKPGQLGIGEKVNYRNIPTKVISADEFAIKQVTCGQNHVLAVSNDVCISIHISN